MRLGRGFIALAALFSFATIETCVYPTEHDADVHVSVTPLPILIRGNDTAASARAWQMLAAGDSAEIANVSFVWTSSNPSVATVDAAGHIVGIKSGTTVIRAAAANFDKRSQPGEDTLRVAEPLEIDSIRPQTVEFGETVTLYGVGVDSIFQASLGNGVLIPNVFTRVRDATGYARITYWVPPPSRRDSLFYIGNGVFGFSRDTVRVFQRDLYEPNDLTPTTLDLDGPRPFPGTPFEFVLFLNPALAFEVLLRDSASGADWYRLQQATTRDLTIILTAPEVKGTFGAFVSNSLGGPSAWTLGPGSHTCRGGKFSPKEAVGDSTIVALAGIPPGTLDVYALYGQAGRYGLTVAEGYFTSDSLDKRIVKDAQEEDDYCDAPGAQVTQPLGYKATLTIDNPHDVDWIRFTVPSATPVRIRTAALPAVTGTDTSDIDVYVLRDTASGAPLDSIGGYARPGSTIDTTFGALVGLPAGNYFAVVVDFAGVPTPYAICIGIPSACLNPFPVGPVPSPARVQAAARRRTALEASKRPSSLSATMFRHPAPRD
jgi:Big-like domain-containing protein